MRAWIAVPVLLALVALAWDRSDAPQPTELSQSRAAGFAKAAKGARSWAAQVFGAPQFQARSRQQKLSDIGTSRPEGARVRGARGRVDEARPRFHTSAAELSGGGESSSFYEDALASLPPAPRLSSLRGPRHVASFSDDAMKSLLSVRREASTSAGRTAQLAQEDHAPRARPLPRAVPPPGQRAFALAPEGREDSYDTAQDFGASLARLKAQHDEEQRHGGRGQRRAPAAAAEQHDSRRERPAAPAAVAHGAEAAADAWGIPNGAGEAFRITRYNSAAAARRREVRTAGISGRTSQSDIEGYFSRLVASAREQPAQKYFSTEAPARSSMLSEEAAPRSTVTALHPRGLHGDGVAAPAVHGGGEELARTGETVPVESVDRAVSLIKDEALAAEKAILRETAAARSAISHARSASQAARASSEAHGQASAVSATDEGHLKALFHAVAASIDEGRRQRRPVSGLQAHRLTGEDARKDLSDGLEEQFRGSREKDRADSLRLRALNQGDANGDLATFLQDEASKTRRQDALDEARLREREGGGGSLSIAKEEEANTMRSEREYEGALRDALHGGALPVGPDH